jgi:hypothetical protein
MSSGKCYFLADDGNFCHGWYVIREGLQCEPKMIGIGKVHSLQCGCIWLWKRSNYLYFSDVEFSIWSALICSIKAMNTQSSNCLIRLPIIQWSRDVGHNQGLLYERIRQGTEVAAAGISLIKKLWLVFLQLKEDTTIFQYAILCWYWCSEKIVQVNRSRSSPDLSVCILKKMKDPVLYNDHF